MKKAGEYKNLITYKPTVLIPHEIAASIRALVNGTDAKECQWFHQVNRITFRTGNRVVYSLEGIYIPEQEVTAATVESDPVKGLMGLWKELKDSNLKEDGTADTEVVNAIVSKMNVWAHSHVNMACIPSGTDESTFKQWWTQAEAQESSEPSIMMIVNKRDEVYIRVFDPYLGVHFENPDIEISYPEVDLSYVQNALKDKIKVRSFQYQTGFQANGGHFNQHNARVFTGQNSSPSLVGETDSPGKAITTALLSTIANSREAVPTWSRAGKAMASGRDTRLEGDLYKICTSNSAEEESTRVTQIVDKVLSDVQELYVFQNLLRGDYELVETFVSTPKIPMPERDQILTNIQGSLMHSWCAHHNFFYALICLSGRICSITGETKQKRMKHLEVYMKELKLIEDDWGVQALCGLEEAT